MDCPHCHEENLLGARICAHCGKSMVSAPPGLRFAPGPAAGPSDAADPVVPGDALPRTTADAVSTLPATLPARRTVIRRTTDDLMSPLGSPSPAAPSPAASTGREGRSAAQVHVLCRVCSTPFERTSDAHGAAVCPACCEVPTGSSAGQAGPQPPFAADAANAAGSSLPPAARPRPLVIPRRPSRVGPGLVAALLVAGLAAAAFVAFRGGSDRAPALLSDARDLDATVLPHPAPGSMFRHACTLTLHVVREDERIVGPALRTVDLRQTSEQECEAAFVDATDEGPVFDVAVHASLRKQSGVVGNDDAAGAPIHPWLGRQPTVRVRAAAGAPLAQLDGGAVTPGANVPPLFHLGALGARTSAFKPGDRWKSRLELPLAADRTGRAATAQFPVEVTYAGAAVRSGLKCAAFRVKGAAPLELSPPLNEQFRTAEATVSGAVWFELATGVVVAADLDATTELAGSNGKTGESLTITARLTIERR